MFLLICLIAICAVGLVVLILLWWEHGLCVPSADTLTPSNTLSLNTPDMENADPRPPTMEDADPRPPTYDQVMKGQVNYSTVAGGWVTDTNHPWDGQGDWNESGDLTTVDLATAADDIPATPTPLGARTCPMNYQTDQVSQQLPPLASTGAPITSRIRANRDSLRMKSAARKTFGEFLAFVYESPDLMVAFKNLLAVTLRYLAHLCHSATVKEALRAAENCVINQDKTSPGCTTTTLKREIALYQNLYARAARELQKERGDTWSIPETLSRDPEYLQTKVTLESGLNHYWSEVTSWLNGEQTDPQEASEDNTNLYVVHNPMLYHDTDRV